MAPDHAAEGVPPRPYHPSFARSEYGVRKVLSYITALTFLGLWCVILLDSPEASEAASEGTKALGLLFLGTGWLTGAILSFINIIRGDS